MVTNKGKLFLQFCYLAGPIDRVADNGKGWREMMTPFLEEMGVIVMDPLNKKCKVGLEDDDSRHRMDGWLADGDFNSISENVKKIRRADMRMVDKSDFLCVHLPTDVHVCGTYRELFLAVSQVKPIVIHCPQGKKGLPRWLFGEIPHQLVFDSWSDVGQYLKWLNLGDARAYVDKHWLFFDFQKEIREALREKDDFR